MPVSSSDPQANDQPEADAATTTEIVSLAAGSQSLADRLALEQEVAPPADASFHQEGSARPAVTAWSSAANLAASTSTDDSEPRTIADERKKRRPRWTLVAAV